MAEVEVDTVDFILCLHFTYTLPKDLHPIGVRLALRNVVGAQRVSSLVSFKYCRFWQESQGVGASLPSGTEVPWAGVHAYYPTVLHLARCKEENRNANSKEEQRVLNQQVCASRNYSGSSTSPERQRESSQKQGDEFAHLGV
jgi:hypothetical protein